MHLTYLKLVEVHKDYLELFLEHKKTILPNDITLSTDYSTLRKVTYNFKREAMRVNCAKITHLVLIQKFKMSKHFKDYFPNVKKFKT
jgi:hypothetical protein